MEKSCKYTARIAENQRDMHLAQALRASQFGANASDGCLDADSFDDRCKHVLIEDCETGVLQACFRFLHITTGRDLLDSYSAQFYDLQRLAAYKKPMLEIGRFCLRSGSQDAALLRVAWAFLTRYVDREKITFMFGCSSFEGVDPAQYTGAFILLKQRHMAPDAWMPQIKAGEVFEYADQLKDYKPDLKRATQNMPPMLRSYLAMGGWVSDHAVIDRELGTLHVFTGVEISTIPAVRARLLRQDAEAL